MDLLTSVGFVPKRVLIAPLNWGLGHASRSADVIMSIQASHPETEIVLASDDAAAKWLRLQFPTLKLYELPGYEVHYGKGKSVMPAMLLSAPRILRGIYREHRILQRLIPQEEIDLVISDCRFGLWSKLCTTVFITHQLELQPPGGKHSLASRIANYINRFFIKRFHHCWVPDLAEQPGLAGALSHPGTLPHNCRYIGPLSRFKWIGASTNQHLDEGLQLLCIVSGPEPQRAMFLQLLLEQLEHLPVPTTVVAGTPGTSTCKQAPPHVKLMPHLPDEALWHAIQHARLVISRPGYSTIMDLWYAGGKMAFVPTPGQTEQEYLALLLEQQGIAGYAEQADLNLKALIEQSDRYSGFNGCHT